MSPNGEGIAKIKNFPVFIKNAKLNEHVKIKITDIGSGCADAQIVTLIAKAPQFGLQMK